MDTNNTVSVKPGSAKTKCAMMGCAAQFTELWPSPLEQ